jgi:hypothetical protein
MSLPQQDQSARSASIRSTRLARCRRKSATLFWAPDLQKVPDTFLIFVRDERDRDRITSHQRSSPGRSHRTNRIGVDQRFLVATAIATHRLPASDQDAIATPKQLSTPVTLHAIDLLSVRLGTAFSAKPERYARRRVSSAVRRTPCDKLWQGYERSQND